MHRTFLRFNQVFNLRIARTQTGVHGDRRNDKWLFRLQFAAGIQSTAQQPVDRPLEGVAGTPLLLLHKHGNVVVNGESSPHIMMLCHNASRCQV